MSPALREHLGPVPYCYQSKVLRRAFNVIGPTAVLHRRWAAGPPLTLLSGGLRRAVGDAWLVSAGAPFALPQGIEGWRLVAIQPWNPEATAEMGRVPLGPTVVPDNFRDAGPGPRPGQPAHQCIQSFEPSAHCQSPTVGCWSLPLVLRSTLGRVVGWAAPFFFTIFRASKSAALDAVRALCEKLAVLHHREFGKFRRLKGHH